MVLKNSIDIQHYTWHTVFMMNNANKAKQVIQSLNKAYLTSASTVQLILSDAHDLSLSLKDVRALIAEVQNEAN